MRRFAVARFIARSTKGSEYFSELIFCVNRPEMSHDAGFPPFCSLQISEFTLKTNNFEVFLNTVFK